LVAEHAGTPAPAQEEAPPVSERVSAAAGDVAETVVDSVITAAATAVAAAEQALGVTGSAEEEE
jgi:hypothetical protein